MNDERDLGNLFYNLELLSGIPRSLLTQGEKEIYEAYTSEAEKLEEEYEKLYPDGYGKEISEQLEDEAMRRVPGSEAVYKKLIDLSNQLIKRSGKDSPDI